MKRGFFTLLFVLSFFLAVQAQEPVDEAPLPGLGGGSTTENPASEERPQIDPPPAQAFVFGPRVGAGISFVSKEEFTQGLRDAWYLGADDTGTYNPWYSIFGFNMEYRVLLGQTRDHFAIQALGFLFGLEQSLAIPAGALMMGYRHHGGFEFGVGPVYNPSGMGVLLALGYTFSVGGVNIPLDLAYQIENNRMAGALSLTTGFNFTYDSTPARRSSRW